MAAVMVKSHWSASDLKHFYVLETDIMIYSFVASAEYVASTRRVASAE